MPPSPRLKVGQPNSAGPALSVSPPEGNVNRPKWQGAARGLNAGGGPRPRSLRGVGALRQAPGARRPPGPEQDEAASRRLANTTRGPATNAIARRLLPQARLLADSKTTTTGSSSVLVRRHSYGARVQYASTDVRAGFGDWARICGAGRRVDVSA
jgi:hypothetical protein